MKTFTAIFWFLLSYAVIGFSTYVFLTVEHPVSRAVSVTTIVAVFLSMVEDMMVFVVNNTTFSVQIKGSVEVDSKSEKITINITDR